MPTLAVKLAVELSENDRLAGEKTTQNVARVKVKVVTSESINSSFSLKMLRAKRMSKQLSFC